MFLARFLWITPFVSFIIGYLLISLFFSAPTLKAPTLIGQSIEKAAVTLSQKNLNLRIVGHKDETDLPEGTIISQTPSPGTSIKEHQALYLVLARKPSPLEIANLKNKTIQDATKTIEAQSLQAKIVQLPADHQNNCCFAQYPCAGTPAINQQVIVYTATASKPVIMPNLKKRTVEEVTSFLSLHGCGFEILHTTPTNPHHQCTQCVVIDQRPMPGSLFVISDDKPCKIQLQVG